MEMRFEPVLSNPMAVTRAPTIQAHPVGPLILAPVGEGPQVQLKLCHRKEVHT